MSLDINLTDLSKDDRRTLEHTLGIGATAKGVTTRSITGKPILIAIVSLTKDGPLVDMDSKLTPASTQHMLASLLLEHVADFDNDDLTSDATSRVIRATRRILAEMTR